MTEWLESPAVPRETMVQLSGGAFFKSRQYCPILCLTSPYDRVVLLLTSNIFLKLDKTIKNYNSQLPLSDYRPKSNHETDCKLTVKAV